MVGVDGDYVTNSSVMRVTEIRVSAVMLLLLQLMMTMMMVAFFFKSRSIQSGEKERPDLSGIGCGHLVLVCADRRRPRTLLKVNKLRRRPAAQIC